VKGIVTRLSSSMGVLDTKIIVVKQLYVSLAVY
jgi:hypothetical protein